MAKTLTFRSSKVVYYGPHPCPICGVLVARMGDEFGGSSFTYPDGPIYPNTEWHVHACDPEQTWKNIAQGKRKHVIAKFGEATRVVKDRMAGWVVMDPSGSVLFPNDHVHCSTELNAWEYVFDRMWSGSVVEPPHPLSSPNSDDYPNRPVLS